MPSFGLAAFVSLMMTAFALSIVLLQNSLPPQALWNWPTVAEAWTAPNEQSTIDSGYRMFTAPDMRDICARAPRQRGSSRGVA